MSKRPIFAVPVEQRRPLKSANLPSRHDRLSLPPLVATISTSLILTLLYPPSIRTLLFSCYLWNYVLIILLFNNWFQIWPQITLVLLLLNSSIINFSIIVIHTCKNVLISKKRHRTSAMYVCTLLKQLI